MASALHVERLGPPGVPRVLMLHGLSGHGRRWAALADEYLPDVAVLAPDLLGHGRSSWNAPWTIEANVAALTALLAETGAGPVLVVGHSFGGGIALRLAAAQPDRVAGVLALDPAAGIDGGWAGELAEAMAASPDYADRAEARREKADGSWGEVPAETLDRDLDDHLIDLAGGRVGWRISIPAMMSYWSELTRPAALPAPATPVTVVRATRTQPPFLTDATVEALRAGRGDRFTLLDWDCDHMVAQARPADTAVLIARALT